MTSNRMPVAARSKAWVYGRSRAGIAGSNLAWGMNVSCDCRVLSSRRLCVGLINRPERSYRPWSVCHSVRSGGTTILNPYNE
jgi:hypothetical protein